MPVAPDPSDMTPEERLAEVAAVLAQGVLHLRMPPTRADAGTEASHTFAQEEPSDSRRKRLDSGRETGPHVIGG